MDGWEDGCMYVCLSLCAHKSWGVVFNTFSSIFFFLPLLLHLIGFLFLNGFFYIKNLFIYFKIKKI